MIGCPVSVPPLQNLENWLLRYGLQLCMSSLAPFRRSYLSLLFVVIIFTMVITLAVVLVDIIFHDIFIALTVISEVAVDARVVHDVDTVSIALYVVVVVTVEILWSSLQPLLSHLSTLLLVSPSFRYYYSSFCKVLSLIAFSVVDSTPNQVQRCCVGRQIHLTTLGEWSHFYFRGSFRTYRRLIRNKVTAGER